MIRLYQLLPELWQSEGCRRLPAHQNPLAQECLHSAVHRRGVLSCSRCSGCPLWNCTSNTARVAGTRNTCEVFDVSRFVSTGSSKFLCVNVQQSAYRGEFSVKRTESRFHVVSFKIVTYGFVDGPTVDKLLKIMTQHKLTYMKNVPRPPKRIRVAMCDKIILYAI